MCWWDLKGELLKKYPKYFHSTNAIKQPDMLLFDYGTICSNKNPPLTGEIEKFPLKIKVT